MTKEELRKLFPINAADVDMFREAFGEVHVKRVQDGDRVYPPDKKEDKCSPPRK